MLSQGKNGLWIGSNVIFSLFRFMQSYYCWEDVNCLQAFRVWK